MSPARGTSAGSRVGRQVDRKARTSKVTERIRWAAAAAERHADRGLPSQPDHDVYSEVDDGPGVDDAPEWLEHDDDDLICKDEERDRLELSPGWRSRSQLSVIGRGPNEFSVNVSLPWSDDPEIERSMEFRRAALTRVADTLIRVHDGALLAETSFDALLRLRNYTQSELDFGSVDIRTPLRTRFGQVPLWFFRMGKPLGFYENFLKIARHIETNAQAPTTGVMVEQLRIPRNTAETIRRNVLPTLVAALDQRDVVARHRSFWPATTPAEVLDDLGLERRGHGASGRSEPAATLALVGALVPDKLILPRGTRQVRTGGV